MSDAFEQGVKAYYNSYRGATTMEMSEKIDELAAALCGAQKIIEGSVKDGENEFFKKKGGRVHTYSTLASVWDAIREPFTKNGLSVFQAPSGGTETTISMTTMVLHISGQWIRETFTVPIRGTWDKEDKVFKPADVQSACAGITYCRRYGLASIGGVCPEDDDGNAACGKSETDPIAAPKAKASAKPSQASTGFVSLPQTKRFWAIAYAAGTQIGLESDAVEEHIGEWLPREYGIESTKKIPSDKYDEIIDKLLDLGGGEWADEERAKMAAQKEAYAKSKRA